MDQESFIEQEVQRRIAANTRQHHQEIEQYQGAIRELQTQLVNIVQVVQRLEDKPFYFGTLVKSFNTPDPARFQTNDTVIVVDPDSNYCGQVGKIAGYEPVVSEEGLVKVSLTSGITETFSIGLNGRAQVRLADKSDGTAAIINIDGKPWEVRGAPDLDLKIGDPVKIHSETKQIVSRGCDEILNGPICSVDAITERGVEISDKGERKFVFNPRGFVLEEGDRVIVDSNYFVIIDKMPKDARQRYKLKSDGKITWDDVGGLSEAKQQFQDAIELPYKYPEQYKFHNVRRAKGLLLWGPPGCGKSLLARALAWSLAQQHGKDSIDSGYIYVKSPEILDKWVGNSESEIRYLFERGRKHYREHGYPAVLVFDEFDAIAPQRGTRRSSDVADTIVPMFLGEMDGVNEKETAENPIVIVMTNRADVIDPAITRDERISAHVKVGRPDSEAALEIMQIHSADMQLPVDDKLTTLIVAVQDIFSKSRVLYRVNNEHDFTFGHTVNGAMLAAICNQAKLNALHRDIRSGTLSSVTIEDFRHAVKQKFDEQHGKNHSYDLADFAESLGIQAKDMKIDRCFGSC